MNVKIEKGKPIPNKSRPGKYPWASLEIGDSFLAGSRYLAYGSLAHYNSKMKRLKQRQVKIETHQEGDKCRVWRIK
jgi:hypothetical protein